MHDSKLSFAIPLATKVKVRPFLPRGWGGGGGGGGGGAVGGGGGGGGGGEILQ